MSEISTLKKYTIILKEFAKRENRELSAYDEVLNNELELSPKQIERLLKELSGEFDNIQQIKKDTDRKNIYKLIKPIDLFVETFSQSEELGWFFNMAHEADPEIFKGLEKYANENKSVYKFQNSPFEDISTLDEKDVFKKLQRAVKNREYIKLSYTYTDEVYDNLKALKLLFIDNNWYIALIDNENRLRLSRISFVKRVDYATKTGSFQPSSVQEQMDFLDTKLQNAMTLYAVEPKIAKLKANPQIARYFEKDMKKFLDTQKYLQTLKDGSVIFTLEYTQEIEIFPFIQKWLPDIIILEPKELKESYLNKLQSIINYQK